MNVGSEFSVSSVPLSMCIVIRSLIIGPHVILSARPLPHCVLQMENFHIISSYSVFCFSFRVHCAALSCIYCVLFRSCSGDRIVNLLVGFFVLLPAIPWERFRSVNYFGGDPCETQIRYPCMHRKQRQRQL